MKYLFYLLFLPIYMFSQQPKVDDEIFIYQDGWGQVEFKYTFESVNEVVWDHNGILRDKDKYGRSLNTNFPIKLKGNITIVTNSNGFDYILSHEQPDKPVFGNAIYKVTVEYDGDVQSTFYLNTIDCNYPNASAGYNDFTIKYLHSNKQFYFAEGKGVLYSSPSFVNVTNQTVSLWETEPIAWSGTSCYELFLNVTSQNGHPYLSWNPYHTSVSGYYVHKKLTTESGTITTQHFTTSTNWTDNDFTIGNPRFTNDEVEYWITAKLSGSQQSLDGNNVSAVGKSWIQWKIGTDNENSALSYKLNQNYPNPFNPSTIISYQLQKDGLVSIKVFDILGKEVADLINEKQDAGNYQIEFNAYNLPSGTYFYKIVSGNFTEVKKMILLR